MALIVVLLSVTLGVVVLGSAVAARHRAQTAADLGALAGAHALPTGVQSACAAAESVIGANAAGMVSCAVDQLDVAVTVQTPAVLRMRATAGARAGPGHPG